MENTLQSTRRIGYFAVPFSRALMCPICTDGLSLAFLAYRAASTKVIIVDWGISIGHERKRVFALNQADFDIDAIE